MGSNQEIERKFLVARPPAGLEDASCERLRQGYVALTDDRVAVRIRASDDGYRLTVKHGGGQARTEVEVPIAQDQFEALWPLTEGRRIRKTRFYLAVEGGTAEIDRYDGALDGLWTVEVEFDDEAAADAFTPPDWFGREVTGDGRYQNASLAVQGRPG